MSDPGKLPSLRTLSRSSAQWHLIPWVTLAGKADQSMDGEDGDSAASGLIMPWRSFTHASVVKLGRF
jgi:hypothetical protein